MLLTILLTKYLKYNAINAGPVVAGNGLPNIGAGNILVKK